MFKEKANTTFNTVKLTMLKIDPMHESMERLYQAALALKKTEGQSNVARLLNESPQVVKNWEVRGISTEGAINAEMKIGCSPAWLRTGQGQMAPIGVTSENAEMAARRAGISNAAVTFGHMFDGLEPAEQLKVWVEVSSALMKYPERNKEKLAEVVKYLTAI